MRVSEIDLHPESLGQARPEQALAACRAFLRECLSKGRREARIITGLGLHGDGTPRLRRRVELEVIPGFEGHLEDWQVEQSGAVLHLWFKPPASPQGSRQRVAAEAGRKAALEREERLMVAWQRYRLAKEALDEDDLRKARLKVNQFLREFMPQESPCAQDRDALNRQLRRIHERLDELEG